MALRDAVFCLSNYYTIDRLNLQRGFSKSTWIERDEGELGLLVHKPFLWISLLESLHFP